MRQLKSFFQGLTGQLITSYLVVTLVVTLSLQAMIALWPLLQEARLANITPAQILEKQSGALVSPFLVQPDPDQAALQYLAVVPIFNELHQADARLSLVVILNRGGEPLASGSCTQAQLMASGSQACSTAGTKLTASLLALPAVRNVIQGALSGSSETAGVINIQVEGNTVLAVPITGGDKQFAGVLLAAFNGLFDPALKPMLSVGDLASALAKAYWDRWQSTWFYFLLVAATIGAFTGFLTSQRITRRLQRLALAAKTWSQGEFQSEVQDRSSDEIGQLARDLNTMAGEIQSLLLSRQRLAVVNERNRLARDLHDTVKQQVFSSALLVHAARLSFDKDPVIAQKRLEETEALHEKIQEALVEALQALKPADVTGQVLPDLLQEFTRAWESRTNIQVGLTAQLPDTLTPEIEETLYRVAQEALANIARHSNAHKVEIRVVQENGGVTMVIQDDGHGFDLSDSIGKGAGLTNMRERVELAHGKFELTSSPGGTILVVRFSGIEPHFSA